MITILLAAALPLVAAPAAADPVGPVTTLPSAEPREGCPDLRPRIADSAPLRPGIGDPTRRVEPRTLDELPPGRLEFAVFRQVDGCAIPAVIRDGIGGAPAPERRR